VVVVQPEEDVVCLSLAIMTMAMTATMTITSAIAMAVIPWHWMPLTEWAVR
jgi:hypothetical protein